MNLHVANTGRGRFPFDLAATSRDASWRTGLYWPVSSDRRRSIIAGAADRLATVLSKMDEGSLRDAVIVGFPALVVRVVTLTAAADVASMLRIHGGVAAGGPPEFRQFVGTSSDGAGHTPATAFPAARPRFQRLRSLARSASWSTLTTLPRAMISPDAVVLSHNSLLHAYLRSNRIAARYEPAKTFLAKSVAPASELTDEECLNFASLLSEEAIGPGGIEEQTASRLHERLVAEIAVLLQSASHGMSQARSIKEIPDNILTGAQSGNAVRAISHACRLRNGSVTMVDHGGGVVATCPSRFNAVRDYLIADNAVMPTPKAASAVDKEWKKLPEPFAPRTKFIGGPGEPVMRRAASLRRTPPSGTPRALYLPLPMIGFRELVPPLLPDVVILDWQLRLAKMLAGMPVDVRSRPHPEGALPGDRNPVSQIIPPARGRFVEVVERTDRLIFEYPHSTAFWEALCTDRPVIYIDLALGNLSRVIESVISRRCKIVSVVYDERNLPQVDPDELTEAVCSGPSEADPSEIRSYLVG